MDLSAVGESRVRGYLYVLDRSLRTFLPRETVADAVREVESHIRDRVASAPAMPNERDALERILEELGAPLRVARAYSDELTVDEAVTSGRILAVVRAIMRVAGTSVAAFFAAIALFIGYTLGLGFVVVGLLKPIFPANVGLWFINGLPVWGAQFPAPEGPGPLGGYWIVPISIALGGAVLIVTHRAARSWLQRFRGRFRADLSPIRPA